MTLFFTSLAVVLTLLSASMDIKLEAAQLRPYFALSNHLNMSSFMRLSLGFNLSIASAYDATTGFPIDMTSGSPSHPMFEVGVPNLDGGLFLPILSSASFNSSETGGFSLGFYFGCTTDEYSACLYVPHVYLAVCEGSSGNMSNVLLWSHFFVGLLMRPLYTVNGFVIPVWIANLHHPIENPLKASLVAVQGAHAAGSSKDVLELQLRDGDEVVWNVSNVGIMEMSDSGVFSIYHSDLPSSTRVFQSNIVDTLLEGQYLSAGMQLTSNDSAYSAKKEKGGLVLFLNRMGPQAPPYWIFPFLREDDPSSLNLSMNEVIFSAPCNDTHSSYLPHLSTQGAYSGVSVNFTTGRCRTMDFWYTVTFSLISSDVSIVVLWSFLRLESDGRIYVYAVFESSNITRAATRLSLSSSEKSIVSRGPNTDYLLPSNTSLTNVLQNGGTECDVPLACGPLAICTPGVKSFCACPADQAYFEPIDTTDFTQGCKRLTSLPSACTVGSARTSFVGLNSTANIFLLTGWTFEFPGTGLSADVDGCKQACSLNCSCHGVSYQVSTSSCFLITHDISLLNVFNSNAIVLNLSPTLDNFTSSKEVFADDYVTFLKVASLPSQSSKHEPNVASTPTSSAKKVPKMAVIAGILVMSVVICFLFGVGGYHLRKRRRDLLQQAKEDEELLEVLPLLPTRFSYKQLLEATKGFSNQVGAGGCGSVYAGTLSDGRKVAVKVSEGVLLQGARQSKEFLAEVAAVGRTGHHNIVRLVGFCWQVSHRILVYEYVERGSLDRLLFESKENLQVLDWEKRYDIALGVARGLHYLHEQCEQPILHFDIKPQNILLSDAFVAKIADFGMSRLMQRDMTSVLTGVRGTPGYIAPEWLSIGTVSKKSDIYSLGIVMLELVAGRKVLDSSLFSRNVSADQQDAWYLPSWAAKKWEEGCLMDIVDPRLTTLQVGAGFDEVQVQRLLYTALWCIHEDPVMRPHAAAVVQWLENPSFPIQPPPVSASSISKPSATNPPHLLSSFECSWN